MASKTVLVGLEKIFTFDEYLINQDDGFTFLCEEYRARSILRFCLENKFLDE